MRPYDHGKEQYRVEHASSSQQDTRHIIANELLDMYGASQEGYKQWSDSNYRMGSKQSNGIDKSVDHQIKKQVFESGGSKYDPSYLCGIGISKQQQIDRIGARFDAAKTAYKETGESTYLKMQKDFRKIADKHLDADLRQFKMSSSSKRSKK